MNDLPLDKTTNKRVMNQVFNDHMVIQEIIIWL